MKTGFFAIGLAEWRQACEIGLNPAVAFLVLASGTGGDNQTTSWSAESVQKYSGIRWERAKLAIEQLIQAGLVTLAERSKKAKPCYKLKISEDRIWLPNNVVTPLAGEEPIINRLRQVQDVMVLRLFVELYDAQNLAADGGIARDIYSRKYEKTVCRDVGNLLYLGFTAEHNYMKWGAPVVDIHKGPKGESKTFFDRMNILKDMGLVQEAKYLFESSGPDAEILFPIDGPEPDESKMRWEAEVVVATNLQGGEALIDKYDYVIPVYRHQQSAELYGIYRMRLRAQTTNTGAWYANLREKSGRAINMFRKAIL